MSNQDSKKQPSQSASYSDLFERLRDYSLLLDPHTHVILESNPACDNLSGAGGQLVGAPVVNLVEPNEREEFEKSLRVAMRRHHSRQFDSRWVLPDSRTIHVDVLACPLQLSSGSTVLQVIARDVSFQREAEAKMKNLLEELKTANTQLEVLSTHDGMTGLSNFRHFRAQLEQIHERSGRYNRPYAILFCDIDHFKKYNEKPICLRDTAAKNLSSSVPK
jgi:PAS domain S-box-containing protein